MNESKIIREAVRAILVEALGDDFEHDEFGHSRDGRQPLKSNEVVFPVYLPDDSVVMVTANYNERTPFEVEIWKAADQSGHEVDIDELKSIVPNLEDSAWEAIEKHYR